METLLEKLSKKASKTTFIDDFKFLEKFVSLFGLNFLNENIKFKKSQFSWIGHFSFGIYLFVSAFVTLAKYHNDIGDMISGVAFLGGSYQGLTKLCNACLNSKKLIFLKNIILKKTIYISNEQSKVDFEAVIMNKNYCFSNCILKLFSICYLSILCGYVCAGLFSSKPWTLPFIVEMLGFGHRSHPGYEIHFICISYITAVALSILLAYDGLFFICIIFIKSQLEICKMYISKIGDQAGIYNTDYKQKILLIKCCRNMSETYTFIFESAALFKYTNFVQILSITQMLCVTMLHIRLELFNQSYFLFIVSLLQLFVYCYFGEIIVSQCEELSISIYCSQWYNITNKSDRKLILNFLTYSQWSVYYSAGGVMVLSMTTFTVIAKSAASFCAFIFNFL